MKILTVGYNWSGGTMHSCARAFTELGHDVASLYVPGDEWFRRRLIPKKITNIKKIEKIIDRYFWNDFNREIIKTARSFKPDIFFTLNESYIHPETLHLIKKEMPHCKCLCWIADNPFDSSRFKYLPFSFKYFDHLFLGDMIWEKNIKMIAPRIPIDRLIGAYDPELFKQLAIDESDRLKYGAKISFAGTAYGMNAEGYYRSELLASVAHLNLKIWGDGRWERYYELYPEFKSCYQGRRLSHKELNIMNQSSRIVLNISNPQCFNAFQQRTFEIIGSGGFQLADYRKELFEIFSEEEIATFKSAEELGEKAKYFLSHEKDRIEYIQKARMKMNGEHTYRHRMNQLIAKSKL